MITGSQDQVELTEADDSLAHAGRRYTTGCEEFDQVCGGGIVPGSVILVWGDPGIGKSTLLLQMVTLLGQKISVLYISGKEGVEQIRMRAQRLGLQGESVQIATSNCLEEIVATLDKNAPPPAVVVIDSIQTMGTDAVDSVPGTVSQIRSCTGKLVPLAKKRNVVIVLVGHVTKEGVIAGPAFWNIWSIPFFILKENVVILFACCGPTDEIGVFDMTDQDLQEVKNPSASFLSMPRRAVVG